MYFILQGAVPQESSGSSSSPRLQHRIPIFGDGYDQPIHSSVDSIGSYPENKKPKVRVIPIEVEGAESRPARHRTFSGPVARGDDPSERRFTDGNEASQLKHSMADLTRPSKIRNIAGPRVHNIPIQFEGSRDTVNDANLTNVKKSPKKDSKVSGSKATKSLKSPGKENKAKEVDKVQSEDSQNTGIETSLKKIENVLEELKTYVAEIQEFSGSLKDKKYRYLDEMLTRCMIKLDDVDTMGNENVRTVRKNAVKKVQAQIDLLESKVNVENALETTSVNESQAVTSEIKNTTVGETLSDKSEQQNEVVCESVTKGDQAIKDKNQPTTNDNEIKELVNQLDTEMTESETDVEQIKEDIGRQLDAEMTECEAEVKSTSENIKNQHSAEMTGNMVGLAVTTMSDEPENQLDTEMVEKSNNEPEQYGNVNEIEMSEISESSPVQDSSLKHEIEEAMTEKGNEIETDLPNEDHLKSGNELVMNSEDVEMSDNQSILKDMEDQVSEEIAVKSASSQFKEAETDKNQENNVVSFDDTSCSSTNVVSQNKNCESNIKPGNRLLVSDISNADNSLKDNN